MHNAVNCMQSKEGEKIEILVAAAWIRRQRCAIDPCKVVISKIHLKRIVRKTIKPQFQVSNRLQYRNQFRERDWRHAQFRSSTSIPTHPQMTTGAIIQGEDKARYKVFFRMHGAGSTTRTHLTSRICKKHRLENCYLEYVTCYESRRLAHGLYVPRRMEAEYSTSLVLRQNHRHGSDDCRLSWPDNDKSYHPLRKGITHYVLRHSYPNFHLALYPENFKGKDNLQFLSIKENNRQILIVRFGVPISYHPSQSQWHWIYSHLQEGRAKFNPEHHGCHGRTKATDRRGNRGQDIESLGGKRIRLWFIY